MAPGAHQRGQAGHGPRGVAAPVHTLHAVVQADGGGLGAAVVPGKLADLLDGQAAHLCGPLGRPLQGALPELRPAQGVAFDVVVVQPVVRDELVHQRQSQGRVGARQQLQVFMAFVGRLAAPRIDAHELGALPLGLLRVAPEVQIAAN